MSARLSSLTLACDEGNPTRLPGWCSRVVVVYHHRRYCRAVMSVTAGINALLL
jgi:hypothetical protein